jgi:NAD(P)-dependent dehydrogenase (short-subunit alcohol dehydrogenase family)
MATQNGAIVITGAAGGMGIAIAHKLAGGAELVLVDQRASELDAVHELIGNSQIATRTLVCDVTAEEDVARLASVVAELGGLRSLVHTAGVSPKMAAGRRVLEVDLVGTVRVLTALLPHALSGSAAVCIGSIAGYADVAPEVEPLLDDPLRPGFLDEVEVALREALDGATGYVLAKRGVMRACERLSGAWAEREARIVSIAPGLIDTDMGRLEMEGDELISLMIAATPLKRLGHAPLPGSPEDIAEIVAFLCSERASFVSGCDIRIDGGLVGNGRHLSSLGQPVP